MAREYYGLRSLGWLFRSIQAIAVERNGRDMAAFRMALRAISDWRTLGIFPEGKIAPGDQILPFQTGVALMAIKSKAPVYPAWIDGTMRDLEMVDAYLYPHQARLAFGGPVDFDRSDTSKEGLDAAAAKIREAVVALRDRYTRPLAAAC
jgi:1-acyl-sn-glycerol-3-phosphate acyltransferase